MKKKLFTIKNAWKFREEFLHTCKRARMDVNQYELLTYANNKIEFNEIICNNITWINYYIEEFRPKYSGIWEFREGYALFDKNNIEGYLDKNLKIVYQTKKYRLSRFLEGFAIILDRNTKLYGYMDKNFNIVCEPKYQNVFNFKNGITQVKLNNEWFYIDKNFERIDKKN